MAGMAEDNKKVLPVLNVNTTAMQASHNPNQEIQLGCGCGAASCVGCPGSLGIRPGSEKDVVYQNVAIYLTLAVVIVLGTFMASRVLNMLFS